MCVDWVSGCCAKVCVWSGARQVVSYQQARTVLMVNEYCFCLTPQIIKFLRPGKFELGSVRETMWGNEYGLCVGHC